MIYNLASTAMLPRLKKEKIIEIVTIGIILVLNRNMSYNIMISASQKLSVKTVHLSTECCQVLLQIN